MSETPTGAQRRRGLLRVGDQVQLTDPKNRQHTITLEEGKQFHTHRGWLDHDLLIGQPDGCVVTNTAGVAYVAFRPLASDFVLSMPRGATIIYPKDAGQIVQMADIFPGARVVEAGAGSGGLAISLLRAVGDHGKLHSYELRPDFAQIAQANVERFFGESHPAWQLSVGDLRTDCVERDGQVDRMVLDMLDPWTCLDMAAAALAPGGVLCCYVATATQMSRITEDLRAHGGFAEPQAWENFVRGWHLEGLAVRPQHRMVAHTGFLVTARRLAPGTTAPPRRRRPAPGAYSTTEDGNPGE